MWEKERLGFGKDTTRRYQVIPSRTKTSKNQGLSHPDWSYQLGTASRLPQQALGILTGDLQLDRVCGRFRTQVALLPRGWMKISLQSFCSRATHLLTGHVSVCP